MPGGDDLWPDNIAHSDMLPPVSILKQQAALLGEKTRQLVTGDVVTTTTGNLFVHRFDLVAPTLNYRYELFSISHGVNFYPLNLQHKAKTVPLKDEETFKDNLKAVFADQHTLNVIHSILAQVRA